MLFNSYIFIFAFLPVVLMGFHFLGKISTKYSMVWLVLSSLFFYGWWNFSYVILIFFSLIFNFGIGIILGTRRQKFVLMIGIVINLLLLAYFKYTNFFASVLNVDARIPEIVLPLAISFFTFQQIAYLVDSYTGITKEYNFIDYCLFVTFFPQLIAGPIVHHKDVMPQFMHRKIAGLTYRDMAVGVSIFVVGLFKKVVIADNVAPYANSVFDAAKHGTVLTFFESWAGALAYTFQLYFDFSGYSEMALGLARMFGIILPVNFYSPYKSENIIEFWRRWHVTLSNFLRDYLYIPLGGNKHGTIKRYINVMITMLLGGLWHGAGTTFVVWGGGHGVYLILNQIWKRIKREYCNTPILPEKLGQLIAQASTFVSVVFGWVLFRSENLQQSFLIYSAMLGKHGFALSPKLKVILGTKCETLENFGVSFAGMFHNGVFNAYYGIPILMILLSIVWFAPNTIEVFFLEQPALGVDRFCSKNSSKEELWQKFQWKPSFAYLVIILIMAVMAVMLMQNESEFLYFRF